MRQITCPRCGSNEVQCRRYVQSPLRNLVPAWLWGWGAAVGLTVSAVCAICINIFLLDEGNIEPSMAWTQIGLAALVILLAWLGAWRAHAFWNKTLRCRCLLCGEKWEQKPPDAPTRRRALPRKKP